MSPALRILAIEPYFGGPHADFLEALRARSRHCWTLLAMPARNWKWRMRGSALHLAREAATLMPLADRNVPAAGPRQKGAGFDLVFTSDFLNVAEFRALSPEAIGRLPVVTYFHENQVSYAPEPGKRLDPQYGFVNLVSALASREAWFNSAFHRDAFQTAVKALLAKMPDFVPPDTADSLASRSRVMTPGVDLKPFAEGRRRPRGQPPLTILWNHRWEFDKNPEAFFEVLFWLAEEGVDFRLAVVGEAVRKWPPVFEKARRRLADRLVRFGYIRQREAYERQVCQADVAVSTALHEFFGLPMVEAIAAGCFPLMPARLSYPEIVPAQLQDTFFYRDDRQLRAKLKALLKGKGPWNLAAQLAEHVQQHDWDSRIAEYDAALERAAGR
jgi:glycosyltransferase involved in cell wall biosynthesis